MGAACKTVVGPGVALTKNSGGVESITIGVHELTHALVILINSLIDSFIRISKLSN